MNLPTCQALTGVIPVFHYLTQGVPSPVKLFSMVLIVSQQLSGTLMGNWGATYPLPQLPDTVGSIEPEGSNRRGVSL